MARTKFKWKLAIFSYLILVNVSIKSLPIETKFPSLITTNTVFKNAEIPANIFESSTDVIEDEVISTEKTPDIDGITEPTDGNHSDIIQNVTRNLLRQDIRPGQSVREYAIEITPIGNTFTGRAVISVELTLATREDPIELHCVDLNIQSVMAGVFNEANAVQAAFNHDNDDGILEIEPAQIASSYILIITYTGSLTTVGQGLYLGQYNDLTYLAMNLHATNARRVFPCMDEPTETSIISFTYNNINYNNIVSNSIREDTNLIQFRALEGPPHLWSMAAHNFDNINTPTNNVLLYVRSGLSQQISYASVGVNSFFNGLNEWTDTSYFEIQLNQNTQLSILALPDVSVDWYGLSMIGIWEPYILMENDCSVKQRYTGLLKMAEALARQWFGYVIHPENWQHEWVVSGLASYAAWEVLRAFQTNELGNDDSILDINTLFVTDIVQESLYRDAYSNAHVLDPATDFFQEDEIRDFMNNILKYKSPAILRMVRLVLGDASQDFIRAAGRTLLSGRALQTVNTLHFIDAITSEWGVNGNGITDDIGEYLEPWTQRNGYPLVHVGYRQNGVSLTQEIFGFSNKPYANYEVPITYSISTQPNFDNIHPINRDNMMVGSMPLPMALDDEEGDFVLFNNQGQGYYRVNYDVVFWERIIEALQDPDRRATIHPLNRATLIDDSLNLARAGRIDYEIAFEVVLTMEHETEYAPWKAFIRNMDFLRKRLVALVENDEDLDPDIYLRMVRRSIGTFEREIGFTPEINLSEPAMVSLTRGMVMDHACRSNYQPCIAAAVDWFWDPNNNENVVNPNIPADIRPAVFCTMVREGANDVIAALHARLEIEASMYERVVIMESLTCSSDQSYVRSYLEETIVGNSPYTPEEGLSIFKAAAAASYGSSQVALDFIRARTDEIRARYGGHAKLEEAIYALGQNMADAGQFDDFNNWVYSTNNRLGDSEEPAKRVAEMIEEDQNWENTYMEYVYEWIDENDAPTLIVSSALLFASFVVALLNL